MKIIETTEFFDVFKEKSMTFDQWLEKIEKKESKEKVLQYFKESKSICESCKDELQELNYNQYILAIAADWCGDCQRNIPILEHICQSSKFLELKILKKEDNLDLLVTINGGEKIPYVMFYSKDGYFCGSWIERSYESYKFIADALKEVHFEKNEEFFKNYTKSLENVKDKLNKSTSHEIVNLILIVNLPPLVHLHNIYPILSNLSF